MYLSIVIPTLHESKNLRILIPEIAKTIKNSSFITNYEIIIADDETDYETENLMNEYRKKFPINFASSQTRQGLAKSALEGFLLSRGDVVVLMDGDRSHQAKYLVELIKPLKNKDYDITVGSRYIEGGGVENWPVHRQLYSKFCAKLAKPLTGINDSGSGFFAFKKSEIDLKKIKPESWKIGMEIFFHYPKKIKEIPIVFIDREEGKSKLSFKVSLGILFHVIRLYWKKLFSNTEKK